MPVYPDRVYVCAMPDRGFWTLRCQNCQKDFTIELKPGEHLIDYVRSTPCPHCQKRPDETAAARALGAWHRVIDYRAPKPR